ncbi:MAG: cytochrome c biogenesis protein CcsA [Saprospiraceae bacterium]
MISQIYSIVDKYLLSTRAAGFYLLIFAFAIGAATFIENDFGTSSAQALVYRAKWFEVLMVLFGATIIANIIRFRMIAQKKWASLIFHLSIIIILIGAGVTRYLGYEGMMHIREGSQSSEFLSSEMFVNFRVLQDGQSYTFSEPTFFSTLGNKNFDKTFQLGNQKYHVTLDQFIPNPQETITSAPEGKPTLKVVIAGRDGREEYYISKGEFKNLGGLPFNFTDDYTTEAINIFLDGESLSFMTASDLTQTVMATQQTDTLAADIKHPLILRTLYGIANKNFVIGEFRNDGVIQISSSNRKMTSESSAGLQLRVSTDNESQSIMVVGNRGVEGQPKQIDFKGSKMQISYGSKRIQVPFTIFLKDFEMERYPGTNNPSSYASEVVLNDARKGVNLPFRIYMNNILNYGGYRFFQSSFDPDEEGTYLSVNHDFWGTWISYLGYFLLTLGMIMTFFSKNSRFSVLRQRLHDMQSGKTLGLVLICSLFFSSLSSQSVIQDVPYDVANEMSSLVVQDHRGRFKPLNTMSSEVLRKLAKTESIEGMTSEQVFLSMYLNPEKWENVPLIHLGSHPEVKKLLNTSEKLVPYRSFFNTEGQYILKEQIRHAQTVNPKDQNVFDKAIIKLDEKINIANMVFSGQLMRLFPLPGDNLNSWISPGDVTMMEMPEEELLNQIKMFAGWAVDARSGKLDVSSTTTMMQALTDYQYQKNASILPSKSKIKAELLLNSLDVFGRLRNIYGILGMVFLGVFFYSIFNHAFNISKVTQWIWALLVIVFLFHTLGLGLRWYVSGRAPWSNGYESMIYISWTTMLAGLLFSRKSLGGLTATVILAATILLVAAMSWLDPEITPLVPVLKSYWLTIHVSLEAGSYGFLMLGAVIGMLNLLIIIFMTPANRERLQRIVKELTITSEITLLGGLIMVSIGTYLGGVWANESWGRYWGWDAKETWALVTILVYAFILHMRFIPGLQSVFAFNFASLFGFATVIMTYFGVNYYLSGLHSYAAGDPVPIPTQVYVTAIILGIISLIAYYKFRKVWKK